MDDNCQKKQKGKTGDHRLHLFSQPLTRETVKHEKKKKERKKEYLKKIIYFESLLSFQCKGIMDFTNTQLTAMLKNSY